MVVKIAKTRYGLNFGENNRMCKKTAFIATAKLSQKKGFTMGSSAINAPHVVEDLLIETKQTSTKFGRITYKESRPMHSLP